MLSLIEKPRAKCKTFEFEGEKIAFCVVSGQQQLRQRPSGYIPEFGAYVSDDVPNLFRELLLEFAVREYRLKKSGVKLFSLHALFEEYSGVPAHLRKEYLLFRRRTFVPDEKSNDVLGEQYGQEKMCYLLLYAMLQNQ